LAPFWLSHHRPPEWDRTYEVGGVRLCARCLGTYPVLATFLAAQLAAHAPLTWKLDTWWAIGLLVPALADWVVGRFRKEWGNNLIRTGTGLLLGLALGRSLFIHLQHPFPLPLLLQGALVTAVAVPVILATRRRT
jgi:uncharacterized membrane protein